jgi:glycosyltransferase involved in cell wall biosynthesis
MRVLFLTGSGGLGGAERSLLDVMASLRQAEPALTLELLAAASGPLLERAEAVGVAASVLPLPPSLARLGETDVAGSGAGLARMIPRLAAAAVPVARYVARLRRAIAAAAPDVVHTNSLKMHVLGSWACRGPALVWHLHDYVARRPVTARLLRWNAGRAAVAVANSQSVADDACAVFGERLRVVPMLNAVDLRRFADVGHRLDLDALAGLGPAPPDCVRVGLVATFGRWKGHRTFLEAMALVPRTLPVRGFVIGGPLYATEGSQYSLDELRALAAALGVADRVGFTGFVPQVEDALRALDIIVHASTAPEPFGLVIAEAMATGRAVIASDAGGARELFTPGLDGLRHEPGAAESLAGRIVDLAGDADARARIGRAGRRTAERRFDRARLATELLPVYRHVAHA